MTQRSTELIQYLAKQRPRKLFSILNKVQGHGVGRRVTRVVWKQEEPGLVDAVGPSYWTVTRVRPDQSLKKGDIWGVFTWRGSCESRERRIRSPLKEQWKLFPKDL